jgi:xanthine dehydrogenase molybdenum-binding subunit
MEFTVNGKPILIDPLPGEMLSDLLRERLGLTGTKVGCNESECGACTVLVDSEPVLSCTYPAAKAAGKQVVTIEGLAPMAASAQNKVVKTITGDQPLHPLQEAFILHGAVQCGFCIPGQIMTAYALLQQNPDPAEDEIRHALKDTLCRCQAIRPSFAPSRRPRMPPGQVRPWQCRPTRRSRQMSA